MRFNKYKVGVILIEIQSLKPEKFINLLWNNNILVKKLIRENITTMTMEINLKDYDRIKAIAQQTDTKIKLIKREGISYVIFRIKQQWTLIGGGILFIGVLFYLSSFIWSIQINTDKYISPYEVRQRLIQYGIKPGLLKSKLDIKKLEDKMINDNENIMWLRARIEGSTLKITIAERQEPPNIVKDNDPCDVIAKADGEVMKIFTTAGTALVKEGDIVKKGDVLIKGEQGKADSTYPVHADGQVIAKTFYEYERKIQVKGIKKERTGRKIENEYIVLFGKKIYLKKSLYSFKNCDKIEDSKNFIKKEIYYETANKEFSLDQEKVTNDTVNSLNKTTIEDLDKSVKLIDKKVSSELEGDNLKIRVVFIIEQDIGLKQKL